MNFLDNLVKSEEELNKFLKEYDEHIGLRKQQDIEPEIKKFQFGAVLPRVRK